MENAALVRAGAGRFQAPKAHLQGLAAWQDEDRPSVATAADEVLGGPLPGRAEGDAGQSREADRRDRRGQEPRAYPAARPRGGPANPTDRPRGTSGLDSQTRQARTTTARHPDAPGSRRPDAGAAGPGAGMGGALRAQCVRLPSGTLHARCDRDAVHRDLQEAEVRARCRHRGLFGAIVTLPPWCRRAGRRSQSCRASPGAPRCGGPVGVLGGRGRRATGRA